MSLIAAEIGLGIAFTIISLAPSIPDWLKKNESPQIRVQIRTGLPQTEGLDEKARKETYSKLSMGGAVPNIVLFNANGDRIAHHRNKGGKKKMEQDAPHDVLADYFTKGSTQTPEYITITASGPDAICITSVTVTPPNTQEMWALVPGEIAAECSGRGKVWPWYYSAGSVQITSQDGKTKEDVRPRCLWIDKSGDYDGTYQESSVGFEGFQVHLPDFKLDNSKWKEWQGDLGQMYDSVSRFAVLQKLNDWQCPQKSDPPPPHSGERLPYKEVSACHPDIWHEKPSDDPALSKEEPEGVICLLEGMKPDNCLAMGKNRKRDDLREVSRSSITPRNHQIRRGYRWAGQLVWSQDPLVSVIALCKDKGTRGPAMYSEPEQKFCDVETHTLYPVCGNGPEECFDPLLNTTRASGNEKRELRPRYMDVQHWAKLN